VTDLVGWFATPEEVTEAAYDGQEVFGIGMGDLSDPARSLGPKLLGSTFLWDRVKLI
jgi:hypothetical protein